MSLARRPVIYLATCMLPIVFGGCLAGTSEATFIGGARQNLCDAVIPVCEGKVAGCILDESQVVEGFFPGTRQVIVEVPEGPWEITVRIFLADRISPGTLTTVSWFEPGCADEVQYDSVKAGDGDIFIAAGRDHTLEVSETVFQAGDHLIEVTSDANARYLIKVLIERPPEQVTETDDNFSGDS